MEDNFKYLNVDDLIPYENNPRKNDGAVDFVAKSIEEFGFKVPIVVDKNNIVVAGHTRLKASKKLGLEKVPVIIADDLTDEQVKAFRLADNKVSEVAQWDEEALKVEMEQIAMDMQQFGFDEELEEKVEETSAYTNRIEVPFYEPTGNDMSLKELVDTSKRDALMLEIQQADIPEDVQEFLIMASQRHLVFDYRNIADYYSNASEEVQELMERSALVIIDFDDAIKNGYVKLADNITELIPDEED